MARKTFFFDQLHSPFWDVVDDDDDNVDIGDDDDNDIGDDDDNVDIRDDHPDDDDDIDNDDAKTFSLINFTLLPL